jgi:hypothetical protein
MTTLRVETTGMLAKTWVDHAGRPHSEQLKVEETFHRLDRDNMELTLKFTDPVMYTEPWLAYNEAAAALAAGRLRQFRSCSARRAEFAEYNNQVATPVLRDESKK